MSVVYAGSDVTELVTQLVELNVEPRFVEEPDEHYYVIKGRPVRMTCGAVHAVQLTFNCAGQWVRATHHVTSNDGMLLRASIDVTRQDVDTHDLELQQGVQLRDTEAGETGDDLWCQCHAWPQLALSSLPPQSIPSRRAYVHVAC